MGSTFVQRSVPGKGASVTSTFVPAARIRSAIASASRSGLIGFAIPAASVPPQDHVRFREIGKKVRDDVLAAYAQRVKHVSCLRDAAEEFPEGPGVASFEGRAANKKAERHLVRVLGGAPAQHLVRALRQSALTERDLLDGLYVRLGRHAPRQIGCSTHGILVTVDEGSRRRARANHEPMSTAECWPQNVRPQNVQGWTKQTWGRRSLLHGLQTPVLRACRRTWACGDYGEKTSPTRSSATQTRARMGQR